MAFKADLFAERLKAEKQSLRTFATAVGVSTRTVNRWKSGESIPKAKDMDRIAEILNCSPRDFDPHFVEMGPGEVPIHSRVSVASHNAYQLMRWRYGVSQREIMELAPVLFAIVAGHALRVPKQDVEINAMAKENGLPGTNFQGEHIEQHASKRGKCFGLKTRHPQSETTRNLFCEAMRRLSLPIADYVDPHCFVHTEPEDVPTAAGFIPDMDLVRALAGEDPALEQAIAMGRIHLSKILDRAKSGTDGLSVEDFAKSIRETRAGDIDEQRQAGLRKLKAWRAFYAERYPEKAKEYARLVQEYCHAEGWHPDYYTDDDRTQAWISPWIEERHIDEGKLPEFQRRKAEIAENGTFAIILPHQDPICIQFEKLKRHRAEARKLFEESQK